MDAGDEMVDVEAVAKVMLVKVATVERWYTTGRMPPPVKLGRVIRWRLETIRAWIDGGCKPVQPAVAGKAVV